MPRTRRWRSGEFNGDKVSVWDDEKVLEMVDTDGCPAALTVLNVTKCTCKTG